MASYNSESSNIYDIKKQKGYFQSLMSLSESVCEGPLQVTDLEGALISTIGQGVV